MCGAWLLGQAYSGHGTLEVHAQPLMEELAAACVETVQLATAGRHPQRLHRDRGVAPPDETRLPHRLPAPRARHRHRQGAACGPGPEEARRRLSSQELPRLTEVTVTDVDELMSLIDAVRQAGYAEDLEEYVEGCRCVAVPIHGRGGAVVAAMSVSMPTFRCDDEGARAHLALLRATVARQRLINE